MASFTAQILMFEFVLIGLLSLYGTSTGALNLQPTIDAIIGPWPVFRCGTILGIPFACDPISLVAGQALLLVGSFLNRIGAFAILIYQLITSLGVVTGIPLLGHIFFGFQFFIGIWALGVFTRSDTKL